MKTKVLPGEKLGRRIGFPTINLDPEIMAPAFKQGVYASEVWVNDTKYKGALYYGPRLIKGETYNVLEIHILDFNQQIYGELIEFKTHGKIREPMNFDSLERFKEQLKKDIDQIRAMNFDQT